MTEGVLDTVLAATQEDIVLAATTVGRSLAAGGVVHAAGSTPAVAHAVGASLDLGADSPANVVAGGTRIAQLRAAVSQGDVIVVADDAVVAAEICLRAKAWGALTLCLVDGGVRPRAGSADHVLSRPDHSPARIAASLGEALGRLHVVPGPADTSPGEVCITCADEGIVMEVVAIEDETTVVARRPEGTAEVDTSLVGEVAVFDLVLVHAGMAISLLEPTNA